MFLQSVASGQQNVTEPFAQFYQMGQLRRQREAQRALAQQKLAEDTRQFELTLPVRKTTAAAKKLTAETGAGALTQRITEWDAEPERVKTKHENALARIVAQKGDIETAGEVAGGFDPTQAPRLQSDFSGRAVGIAGRKEGARQTQITKGSLERAKAKQDIKGNDPILRRQLINNIAKAFRSRSIFETQAMDPFKQGPQQGEARKAVQRELAFALQEFRRVTGEPAPTAQEMAAAMQEALTLEGGGAPQVPQVPQVGTTTSGLSAEDLRDLDQLSR